jgi:hypothetical protein
VFVHIIAIFTKCPTFVLNSELLVTKRMKNDEVKKHNFVSGGKKVKANY